MHHTAADSKRSDMAHRIAIVRFPGSNADFDALHACRDVLGQDAYYVFHRETDLNQADAVVIPGGFSYGDYLRPGAIACFSPIVPAVRAFALGGGPVLGICNGFQVLTELQLLPGALTRNAGLRFECRDVFLRVEATGVFTGQPGQVLRLPIAHADGRYQCDDATYARLEAEGRIAFRYCTEDGDLEEGYETNPNGSRGNIAGVYNGAGNVLGLMPHPERAAESILGNDQGRVLLDALVAHLDGATQGAAQ